MVKILGSKKNINKTKFWLKRKAPQNVEVVQRPQRVYNGVGYLVKLNEKQTKELVIKQQKRIIILWNASRSINPYCRICVSTKFCNHAKELWKHITECKNKNCKFKHCASSRYILAHFHQCKDKKCKVCPPVRKEIKKIKKKEKEIAETTASEALMLLQSLS